MSMPNTCDAIVVGGPANGTLLNNVDPSRQFVQLGRNTHVKPVLHAQQEPEAAREEAIYELHPIALQNTGQPAPHVFCIAVAEGVTLTEAFSILVRSFVQIELQKVVQENLVKENKTH